VELEKRDGRLRAGERVAEDTRRRHAAELAQRAADASSVTGMF
jgi:hypothetical protein